MTHHMTTETHHIQSDYQKPHVKLIVSHREYLITDSETCHHDGRRTVELCDSEEEEEEEGFYWSAFLLPAAVSCQQKSL